LFNEESKKVAENLKSNSRIKVDKKKYKILSLDGGGSWALIQAKCLFKMYGNIKGRDLLRQFDLVVANSGGSLVVAALAEDKTTQQVIDIFLHEKERNSVFFKLPFFHSLLNHLLGIGPKYSAEKKFEGLQKLLPKISQTTLAALSTQINLGRSDGGSTHFLIATFDYDRNRASFMRSNVSSKATTNSIAGKPSYISCVTLTQSVHGASNAPVNYFDKPAMFPTETNGETRFFWDGAVGGYNNPLVAGVSEALINGEKSDNICILSIGTGNTLLPLKLSENSNVQAVSEVLLQKRKKISFKRDVLELTTSILAEPPETASFVAYTMLYPQLIGPTRNGFVRMNPLIQPILNSSGMWDFPNSINANDFKRLVELDMDATKQEDVDLIEKFCDAWLNDLVPNQPIRSDENFKPLIGYGRFGDAWKEWKKFQ
jgi:hypothetical protein